MPATPASGKWRQKFQAILSVLLFYRYGDTMTEAGLNWELAHSEGESMTIMAASMAAGRQA